MMLTLDEKGSDILTELVNIGVGKAAGILQSMLNCHIELSIPKVQLIGPHEIHSHISTNLDNLHSTVRLSFSGSLTGDAVMVFPCASARKLVALLTDEPEDSPDVDFMCGSTVTEVGNIVLNGIVGTLTNLLDLSVEYEVPCYSEMPLLEWLGYRGGMAAILLVRTRIRVQHQPIEGEFLLCLRLLSAKSFLERLENLAGKDD